MMLIFIVCLDPLGSQPLCLSALDSFRILFDLETQDV